MDKKTAKLIKQLDHDEAARRYEAVLLLGKTGDTSLINTLDKVATLDEDKRVRNLAYKALKTLRELRKREEEEARRRKQEEEGDLEWNIMATRESQDGEPLDVRRTDSFDYQASRDIQDFEDFEAEVDEQSEHATSGENTRSTRASYRLLLWVSVVLAILVMIAIAYFFVLAETLPEELESWAEQYQVLAEEYDAAFDTESGTLDCSSITPEEMTAPERPESLADYEADYPNFFEKMQVVEQELPVLQQDIQNICGDFSSVRTIPSDGLTARLDNRISDLLAHTEEALETTN